MPWILPWLVLLTGLLLGGCSGSDEAELEAWDGNAYIPRKVNTYEVDGRRDGSLTRAEITLSLADGRRLQLALEVSYNPAPVLHSGQWRLAAPTAISHADSRPYSVLDSGIVYAESMKFLGGQGAGPSLGGRFRLETETGPRFRVKLPLRPLVQPQWQRR